MRALGPAAALLLGACALAAAAQQPPMRTAPVPGARPAPADTVTAPVILLRGDPALGALAVRPDSVTFGGLAQVRAEVGSGAALADSLVLPPWLEAAPGAAIAGGVLTLPVRVYRVDPFRLESGGRVSNVVRVLGRGTDGTRTAPVRAPRARGWNLAAVAAAALALALLAWAAALLWRRRRGPSQRPDDRPLPAAAWPRAAVALEGLLDDLRRGGDGRRFLDGLAAVTRAYAADRFGIPGREMTGREIAAACLRLGHGPEAGRAFARLVADLDQRRYDPGAVGEGWCRDRAADFLAAVAAVRIMPGPGSLPAAELAAGRDAWQRLAAELRPDGGDAA